MVTRVYIFSSFLNEQLEVLKCRHFKIRATVFSCLFIIKSPTLCSFIFWILLLFWLHYKLYVVLDITFYEENRLVDQEFPEDTSPFKIQQLLQDLTEPEVLVQSVLGLELLECLYWRRGALLYMYCHTLHQRKQWIKKNKATFLKVLSPTSHSTVPVLVAMT
uniref:Uncharacterized protein n=1 Tax=Cyprinus carpio TaxID=7962 RepID=A0A8C2BB77_CYPCA